MVACPWHGNGTVAHHRREIFCTGGLAPSLRIAIPTPKPRDAMYDAKKDRIQRLQDRFEEELKERSTAARPAAEEYLKALTEMIRSFNDGPAADPRVPAMDTTGELDRTEDYVAWAEAERHRVRRALRDIA